MRLAFDCVSVWSNQLFSCQSFGRAQDAVTTYPIYEYMTTWQHKISCMFSRFSRQATSKRLIPCQMYSSLVLCPPPPPVPPSAVPRCFHDADTFYWHMTENEKFGPMLSTDATPLWKFHEPATAARRKQCQRQINCVGCKSNVWSLRVTVLVLSVYVNINRSRLP